MENRHVRAAVGARAVSRPDPREGSVVTMDGRRESWRGRMCSTAIDTGDGDSGT